MQSVAYWINSKLEGGLKKMFVQDFCDYIEHGHVDKVYSMLLGRPWFKQAKRHHDWGNNTFIIRLEERVQL
jgi:hypothetical protein